MIKDPGQRLYEYFTLKQERFWNVDSEAWDNISDLGHKFWSELEAELLRPTDIATLTDPIALLKRYGKHDIHCPSTGPCIPSCNFAEVERQWKR